MGIPIGFMAIVHLHHCLYQLLRHSMLPMSISLVGFVKEMKWVECGWV